MEQIIKYELIINKALRSALEYDKPDEQINEFIRFFGQHIGSERFYIFEDDIKHHVTDNTYEWCANDVIPQINELQQVDMDIIVLRLGGAFSREDEALTFDQLYRNADSAMYHSKKIPGCHVTIYNEKLEVK